MAYLNQINQPAKRFSKVIHVIQKGATALERVFETLDTQPEVKEKPDAIALPQMQGHIQWEAVKFAYNCSQPVIHNFTLEMQPGMTVALVGASGAGKTTLANLAARFYDPQQGRILIDGCDIRDVSLNSLRSQMGIVSQETLLLHGTVRENIAYGKPGVNDGEITSAKNGKNLRCFELIIISRIGASLSLWEKGAKAQRERLNYARKKKISLSSLAYYSPCGHRCARAYLAVRFSKSPSPHPEI